MGIIALGITEKKSREEIMGRLTRIEAKIDRRDNLDSLYMNHLKDCSFLDKESIGVGYDGYLYSHYHRTNGKIREKAYKGL